MKKVIIIGGGISGLAALHFLRTRHSQTVAPVLCEKETRLGGTIGTDRITGFISDWGPNGFLDKIPLTLEMVQELGAEDRMERAHTSSGKRFIYARGRLHEISPSPLKFLSSPLLSLKGRLRIASEPFIKPRKSWIEDETIFDFAARRIGTEAAETLIDPMTSGIFGGDARKLSLRACFPLMVEMEKDYGSLVRAMIARKKEAGKSGREGSGPAGPGGTLTSFSNGLNTIVEIFESKYREYINKGCGAMEIGRSEKKLRVSLSGGQAVDADAVICALPAYATAEILKEFSPDISDLLRSIQYASISVVCLGYRREDVDHDLDGFGFVIPRFEGKRILGSIWTSSIFSGRSPEGMVQLRTMIGGATDPEAVNLTDGQLLDIVGSEIKQILGIRGKPVYVRIFRYHQGIPQFTVGHPARMEKLKLLLGRIPGLYLTGNAYEGVGLNDCVVRSDKAVSRMAKDLSILA